MVRNIPYHVTQREFLEELDLCGFAGAYDFAYLPRNREAFRGSGYGFVNFTTPNVAASFVEAWHMSTRFDMRGDEAALSVVPSSIQGFDANAAKWGQARRNQVKNKGLLPFFARAA